MVGVILATAGYDHTIRLWEAATGMCCRTIQFKDSQVNALAVTPDRNLLAAAGYNTVRLFDLNNKNASHVAQFDGHTANITSLGFSSDGKWMYTSSEDKTIRLWDMRAKSLSREFHHRGAVNSVALHPNEREFFAGDQMGEVRVWDIGKEACSHELIPDGEVAIRSVAINPDGTMAVAANNKGMCFVWLWTTELKDLTEGSDVEEEEDGVEKHSHSDGSELLEEVSLLTPRYKLDAHQNYILKTVFSPDGRFLATTSADKTVALWDVASDFGIFKTLEGHQRWVWDCSFSADSAYVVTASSDGTAQLWDVNSGESIKTYNGHDKPIVAVCLEDTTDT